MKKKGLFSAVILVGFIIAAPAISYIYLQQGYEYRKGALEDLAPKGTVQPFNLAVDSTIQLVDEMLDGKVAVISQIRSSEDWEFLTALYNQYKARPELEFWTFSRSLQAPDSIRAIRNWKQVNVTDEAYSTFRRQLVSDPWNGGAEHILTDTSHQIRNIYPGTSKEEQIRLIEHLAIVLPRSKKSDVIYEVPSTEE